MSGGEEGNFHRKDLLHCRSVHHKHNVDYPGTEPVHCRWEADTYILSKSETWTQHDLSNMHSAHINNIKYYMLLIASYTE